MPRLELKKSGAKKLPKKANKKGAGVGRKKVADKTTPVCKFGRGPSMCKKPLKTNELKSGYCKEHQKVAKEKAKQKVKDQRKSTAKKPLKKQTRTSKSCIKKQVKKATTKKPVKKANPKKKTGAKRLGNPGSRKRINIMGIPSSSFIRACYKLGLTKEEATKACKKHLKKGDNMPSVHSFRTQYDFAKHGRAPIPVLTKALREAITPFKK